MKHVNFNTFVPSTAWLADAAARQVHFNGLTKQQRKTYVDIPENKAWNEDQFFEAMKSIGKKRCWYSETNRDVKLYVDHFRPKSKVNKITNRYTYNEGGTRPSPNGYYWLAFAHSNFRISCDISNLKKGTYFPLREGTASVDTDPPGDCSSEEVMLLDPCLEDDCKLLGYNFTMASPTCDKAVNLHDWYRADISIFFYDLNGSELAKRRSHYFQKYYKLFEGAETDLRLGRQIAFSKKIPLLVNYLEPEAEFWSMIYHHLVSTKKQWVNDHVLEEARIMGYLD